MSFRFMFGGGHTITAAATRAVRVAIAFALTVVIAAPRLAAAQDLPPLRLPGVRPVGHPPEVPSASPVTTRDGRTVTTPVSPTFAVADLRIYDQQLETLFSIGAPSYPTDSVHAVKAARATAWVTRLDAIPVFQRPNRQFVDFADVAMRAGQDSLARYLLRAYLGSLPPGRAGAAARAVALAAATALFADAQQDSARLARNMPVAKAYAAQVDAIPTTGYVTRDDSTNVLYAQFDAAVALAAAANAAQDAPQLLRYTDRMLVLINQMSWFERKHAVGAIPYLDVAIAMVAQPNGRARLDTLDARLLALTADRPTDLLPASPAYRANLIANWRRDLRHIFDTYAQLGRPAFPVTAHAWINTSDSAYAPTPRTRTLTDGLVRVIAFDQPDSQLLPLLDRVQRQFPRGVEVLLVTETNGYIGPDIVTPPDEVTWWARYYHERRHAAIPIALWAGPKVPGLYGSLCPAPSVNDRTKYGNGLVLVDGKGIVRLYQPTYTREEEARLVRRVRALLAEGQPSLVEF